MKFIFYAHKERQDILGDVAGKSPLSFHIHQFKHLIINVCSINVLFNRGLVLVSIVVRGGTNVKEGMWDAI